MEIGLSRKGEMHLLSVKGNIRLQSWKVLDKHMDTLLAKGCTCLVIDLSEVPLLCSVGVGAILHNIGKFRQLGRRLLLLSTSPLILETFVVFGKDACPEENLFRDWESLETTLRAQGMNLSNEAARPAPST
jgi:anti-anti-sigma factor